MTRSQPCEAALPSGGWSGHSGAFELSYGENRFALASVWFRLCIESGQQRAVMAALRDPQTFHRRPVASRTFESMLQWFRRRAEASPQSARALWQRRDRGAAAVLLQGHGRSGHTRGAFQLVSLHLFLALESLNQQRSAELDLTQRTIEAFVTDMDDCMREMGVGDLAVPKKVKRAAAAFYERARGLPPGPVGAGKAGPRGQPRRPTCFPQTRGTAPVSRRLPHMSARPRRNYRPSHSMSGLQAAGSSELLVNNEVEVP